VRITIPSNDTQAREVAEQHYLSGWALAGYVASQVVLADGPGGDQRSTIGRSANGRITPTQFAAKGFRGLRSHHTVRLYAERWRDHVGEAPEPGAVVDLPEMDWPPVPTGIGKSQSEASQARTTAIQKQADRDGVGASKAVDIASNPKAMATAIKADPATAKAAADALDQMRGLATEPDPDVVRTMNRMDRERDAWESGANRGQARGSEHETKAMLECQWLHENGHRDSLIAIREYISGLLDLEQAENLTPEMFHE